MSTTQPVEITVSKFCYIDTEIKSHSELDLNYEHSFEYTLNVKSQDVSLSVPFYFNDETVDQKVRRGGEISYDEVRTGRKNVKFSPDCVSYKIEKFTELDSLKIGVGMLIDKDGLTFRSKSVHNLELKITLMDKDILGRVIQVIVGVFNEENDFNEKRRALNPDTVFYE